MIATVDKSAVDVWIATQNASENVISADQSRGAGAGRPVAELGEGLREKAAEKVLIISTWAARTGHKTDTGVADQGRVRVRNAVVVLYAYRESSSPCAASMRAWLTASYACSAKSFVFRSFAYTEYARVRGARNSARKSPCMIEKGVPLPRCVRRCGAE